MEIRLSDELHDELAKMFPKVRSRCPVCYTIWALNHELSESISKDEILSIASEVLHCEKTDITNKPTISLKDAKFKNRPMKLKDINKLSQSSPEPDETAPKCVNSNSGGDISTNKGKKIIRGKVIIDFTKKCI